MSYQVKLGISARHLHVSQEHLEILFGEGAVLHPMKDLGQPGQFACEERVDLVTEKGAIKNVRILGPVRKATQIELAIADARKIGLNPPVRDSGDTAGTPGLTVVGPKGQVTLKEGVILAARHIHLDLPTAEAWGVKDMEKVNVRIGGARGVVFNNVLIRANAAYAPEMHIDTDEGNACMANNDDMVEVIIEK